MSSLHRFQRGAEGQPAETSGEGADVRDIRLNKSEIYVWQSISGLPLREACSGLKHS